MVSSGMLSKLWAKDLVKKAGGVDAQACHASLRSHTQAYQHQQHPHRRGYRQTPGILFRVPNTGPTGNLAARTRCGRHAAPPGGGSAIALSLNQSPQGIRVGQRFSVQTVQRLSHVHNAAAHGNQPNGRILHQGAENCVVVGPHGNSEI